VALAERVLLDGRRFRRSEAKARNLMTWFGVIRYERMYLREVVGRGDRPADRFSPNLMSIAVRLATRVSFSEACELLRWFLRGRAIDGGRRGGEAWLWAAYARVVRDRPRAQR
jgi:hypothetical protein